MINQKIWRSTYFQNGTWKEKINRDGKYYYTLSIGDKPVGNLFKFPDNLNSSKKSGYCEYGLVFSDIKSGFSKSIFAASLEEAFYNCEKEYAKFCKKKISEYEEIVRVLEEYKTNAIITGIDDMKCQNCVYHQHEDITDGYVCVKDTSNYVAEWTENNDYCMEYEK